MDKRERKKRKREEAALVESSKGKVKEEGAASGEVDCMRVDASDEMELDHKVGDMEAPAEGVDNFKGPSVEVENSEKEGPDAMLDVAMAVDEGEGKMEVNCDEQGDLVRVEAPSTPPVHSEEMNFGKPVSIFNVLHKSLVLFYTHSVLSWKIGSFRICLF